MGDLIVKFFVLLRNHGIAEAARKVAHFAFVHEWPFWMTEILLLGNSRTIQRGAHENGGGPISFRIASPNDLEKIVACTNTSNRTEQTLLFEHFFDCGARCAVAHIDNTIVGFLWGFSGNYTITVDGYRATKLDVLLKDRSVFTGNAYVAPPYRNRGLFRQLKSFFLGQYPAETSFYTWVSRENGASLAANRQLGFVPVAALRFSRSLGRVKLHLRYPLDSAWRRFGKSWPELILTKDSMEVPATKAQP